MNILPEFNMSATVASQVADGLYLGNIRGKINTILSVNRSTNLLVTFNVLP